MARKYFLDNCAFVNVYGPTKCCVDVAFYIIPNNYHNEVDRIPIGSPIINNRLFIDPNSQELIICGENVGPGYLEENSTNFYINENGIRCYRTGDKAEYKDNLFYVNGRIDNQVKIHGYRIELSQIDNTLYQLKNVQFVYTMVVSDSEPYILTIVKANNISEIELKKFLNNILPVYMVPKKIIITQEKICLTKNGKLDKSFLNKYVK